MKLTSSAISCLIVGALSLVNAAPRTVRRASEFGIDLPAPDVNYDTNLSNGYRLLQFGENEPPRWVLETEIAEMTIETNGFMDVTALWESNYASDFAQSYGPVVTGAKGYSFTAGGPQTPPASNFAAPAQLAPPPITQQSIVKELAGKIDIDGVKTTMKTFLAMGARQSTSPNGVKTAQFLLDTASKIAEAAGGKAEKFPHKFSEQFSVIATLPGKTADKVILGAHQDSIAKDSNAPGADDDASGSMTIMEIARVVAGSGLKLDKTVEFHWYAGEEKGLLGSQEIAQAYKAKAASVTAMLQYDLVGYAKDPKARKMGIMTDFTDPELTTFFQNLATTYNPTVPMVTSKCGYGCSDHASWNRAGFKAIMPTEGIFEEVTPFIHTAQDTFETLNFDHIRDFIQLGVAFTVELAASGNNSTPAPTTPGGGGNAPTGTAPAPAPTATAPTPQQPQQPPAVPAPQPTVPTPKEDPLPQRTPVPVPKQDPPPQQPANPPATPPAAPAPGKKCAVVRG
ncbi:hypothetical protein DFS34DRAFT_491256 [Phlyctochytrium arcticum]|nr:hypothetical protein DFS34DRAFT_491256 [Phlyctochytrium arcticum]